MKFCLLVLPLLAAGLSSCEKAKQAADAVREKMGGVTDPDAPVLPGGEVAPELASQVDTAAEGVRFRRDLPFPPSVKVRVIERNKFKNARVMSTSELGKQTGSFDGTWEQIGVIERQGPRVTLTVEKSGKVVETKEGDKKGAPAAPAGDDPIASDALTGKPLTFELGPKGWRMPGSNGPVDFRTKVQTDRLQPALPNILAAEGALPRTQWFSSSRRWIGGDKVILEGDSVHLLFPGNKNTGKITLTYEATEALDGHPCGRFSLAGDVSLRDEVDLGGESSNTEMTINSGKVWCSVLYPVVLREEYDLVATRVEGEHGGPEVRIQGGIETVRSRQWKP